MKRIMIASFVALFLLTGCGAKQDVKATEEPTSVTHESVVEGYSYTDVAGRIIDMEADPVRVAVTYLPLWESLLMLDIIPVGAAGAENYIANWIPFREFDLSAVEDIGQSEINFEKLISLKPDLILTQVQDVSNVDVGNYEVIAKVATFGNDTKMDWRLSLREVGKLVNREALAEEKILAFEKTLKEARDGFLATYEGETAVVFSMMANGKLFAAYRPDFYDKDLGLGLNLPDGFTRENTFTEMTLESLVDMDPDHMFVNVFVGDEALYEELSRNPVWQSLKAVKNNNVYILSGFGHSPSSMSTVYTVNAIIEALNR